MIGFHMTSVVLVELFSMHTNTQSDMLLERLNWYSISFCSFVDDLFVVAFSFGSKMFIVLHCMLGHSKCLLWHFQVRACVCVFSALNSRFKILLSLFLFFSFFILLFRHQESLLGRTFSAHSPSLSLFGFL